MPVHCPQRIGTLSCLFSYILLGLPGSGALAESSSRRTGEWLVDLARDYAMSPMVTGRNEDAEIILSYLEAAARVDPAYPDAYLWQYDMLMALGRHREAVIALTRYADLRPADVSARLKTIQLRLELLQTLELRKAFCQEGLSQPRLHPLVRAELSYRLAALHFAELDDAAGESALNAALEACPEHLGARLLRQERSRNADAPASPIDGALAALSMNPLQPDLVWSIAQQLDAAGLHKDAIVWFERAVELFPVLDPAYQVPAAMRIEVAAAYVSAGQLPAALHACQEAVEVEPRAVDARLMMLHVARELSREDLAAEQIARIRQVYDDLEPMIEAARAGRSAAEIALFYARYDVQPDKASRWLGLADTYEPGLPLTQIASGFLALAESRNEKAIELLEPMAAESQTAALGLADALVAVGRTAEATTVLRRAAALLRTGPVHATLKKRLSALGEALDPVPAAPALAQSLTHFDAGVFELARDPAAALSIEAAMINAAPEFGEPWRCRVRIKNVSQRPIHLGASGLLSPQVLVSVEITGDRSLSLPAYLWISADWTPLLSPGESIEVTQTLDVGALRGFLDACPQAELEAAITLIVDAVPDASGGWVASRAGRALPAMQVARAALRPDDSLVSALAAGLADADAAVRIDAGCTWVGLLVEQQLAQGRAPDYERVPVDADRAMSALLPVLQRDPMPHVRARLLDALRQYAFGPREMSSVAGALSDSSWLVRLSAVTTLGSQQGRAFLPVLEGIGSRDPDRLLRQFCGSFANVLKTSSSSPPSTDAPSPPSSSSPVGS